jgi:hypothetical protein
VVGTGVRLGLGREPETLAAPSAMASKVIMRRRSWLKGGLRGMFALVKGFVRDALRELGAVLEGVPTWLQVTSSGA